MPTKACKRSLILDLFACACTEITLFMFFFLDQILFEYHSHAFILQVSLVVCYLGQKMFSLFPAFLNHF